MEPEKEEGVGEALVSLIRLVVGLKRETYFALSSQERKNVRFQGTIAQVILYLYPRLFFKENMEWLEEWQNLGNYGDSLWWHVHDETVCFVNKCTEMQTTFTQQIQTMINWEYEILTGYKGEDPDNF